jgi:hypothetical protein
MIECGLRDVLREKFTIPRYQNESAVMVWGAISKKGGLTLVFIDREVKINGEYYKTEVLEKQLLPAARPLYGEKYFSFQQDGAPSRTSNSVQQWCSENLLDYIPKAKWPPSSPFWNPLDFSICGYMLAQQKNYKYQTLPDFQKVILRIWAAIPDDVMRTACNAFEEQINNYHGKSIRK